MKTDRGAGADNKNEAVKAVVHIVSYPIDCSYIIKESDLQSIVWAFIKNVFIKGDWADEPCKFVLSLSSKDAPVWCIKGRVHFCWSQDDVRQMFSINISRYIPVTEVDLFPQHNWKHDNYPACGQLKAWSEAEVIAFMTAIVERLSGEARRHSDVPIYYEAGLTPL